MRPIKRSICWTLVLASFALVATADDDLTSRRETLDALLAEKWDYDMQRSPEWASILGDKRWNDQSSDLSEEAINKDLAWTQEFLERLEALDTSGFPEQERLNQVLMARDLRQQLEGAKFRSWRMPINQMSGIHLIIPQFASLLSFSDVGDYDDLITRYKNIPLQFDQTTSILRQGMADGLIPPRFLLQKVVAQIEGLAASDAESSPFARPLTTFPDSVDEKQRSRIRHDLLTTINEHVLPAYARLAAFVKEEYAPAGRTEPGMWSLPQGAERYAFAVKSQTTTNLTPEEIHQIGLREVAMLEEEMRVIARSLGFDDLEEFNSKLEEMPEIRAQSKQQILDLYTHHIDAMYTKLPQLFNRLPKASVEVQPVEEFREKEAAGASYFPPAPDGSRPGRVMVNTGDPTGRKTISMESTAYHEGVPGHHMQLAIAQELPTLPPFRQHGGYNVYSEGWALYSERLGKEVGFYTDPYSDYGRLQDEMLRAIRLVVDTGFHAKRWSREEVVTYFRDHSALDEVEIQTETDRYIVWPGQALGYKIGQLKILELRERARTTLGEAFDIRAFHDEVLGAGGLPLDVLEARIDRWIASQESA